MDYQAFETELGPEKKMLAKATRALQDHVKDVTEKTKNTCCVNNKLPMKELNHTPVIPNYHPNDPMHYIVDKNLGITYLRGRLLGKVSRYFQLL